MSEDTTVQKMMDHGVTWAKQETVKPRRLETTPNGFGVIIAVNNTNHSLSLALFYYLNASSIKTSTIEAGEISLLSPDAQTLSLMYLCHPHCTYKVSG